MTSDDDNDVRKRHKKRRFRHFSYKIVNFFFNFNEFSKSSNKEKNRQKSK